MVETPTDEVAAPAKGAKSKKGAKPTAANRYKLFDDEYGDYRIYEIVGADQGLPKGALVPIPEVPGFDDTAAAKKFVKNSGDLLNGKQLLILKGLEICSVQVRTETTVQPQWKPKKPVSGPAAKESEAGCVRLAVLRLVAVLMLAAAALLGGCSSLEGSLDSVKLPRDDVAKVQRSVAAALVGSPDSDDDGTINGLEWVTFVRALVAAWEAEGR